jgi:uncharacterized protein YprB with RNaseH-like and TPR domain
MTNSIIIDIETCPINMDKAKKLEEDERLKLLNPIDSRIVAIGLRYKGNDMVFNSNDEKEMLEKFWLAWKSLKRNNKLMPIVGFNIVSFDIPFIVARSFINNVTISEFTLKEIVDIREKLNAYRYGHTRGKLKEYAELIGLEILDVDGSDVLDLCINNEKEKLKEYLKKDLEITEKIYERAELLNITKIERW